MNDDLIVHEKFLIRASSKELENVYSLPLIHYIHQNFPKCEIDIIISEGLFNVFGVLPFKVNVFVLPKDKSSIAGVHHYAYNLKDVFNVDCFIDLEGGLKEAVLGLSFKSKKRLGFARGLQKYLLTHRVELKGSPKSDSDFMHFAPFLHDDEETRPFEKVGYACPTARESSDTFLFVLIDKIYLDEAKNQLWVDFFDSLLGERIALYIRDVEVDPTCMPIDEEGNVHDCVTETKKSFVEKLDSRNKYIQVPQFDISIYKILCQASHAVVTDMAWVASLGSYLHKESFCFVRGDKMAMLEYYEQIPRWVFVRDNVPYRLIGATENIDLDDVSELIDYIFRDPIQEQDVDENQD